MLGHSFGGYLTYRYMIKHGDDNVVTKYISANGPATTDNDLTQRWQFRRDFLMNEAKEAIAAGRDVAKWQEILNWCNEHAVFDTDEEFLQWNIYVEENIYIYYEEELPTAKDYLNVAFFSSYNPLTASLNMNAAGIVEEQIEKSEKQFSLVQNLNQLDKPLLILTGRHDDVCPPEEAQYIFDHISSAQKRLKILNDAGHHAFHHQPNEFNAAIEDFINE
jgi:pimeloyl-ACP methyl ester carboxylesterase